MPLLQYTGTPTLDLSLLGLGTVVTNGVFSINSLAIQQLAAFSPLSNFTDVSVPAALPNSNLSFLRLTMSAKQTVTSSTTAAKLSFDTVSARSNDWAAPATPLTDIILPYSGLVCISCYDCDFGDSGSGVGFRALLRRLRNDITTNRRMGSVSATAAGLSTPTVLSGTFVQNFTAGDALSILVIQNSTVSLQVALNECFLWYIQKGVFTFSGTN